MGSGGREARNTEGEEGVGVAGDEAAPEKTFRPGWRRNGRDRDRYVAASHVDSHKRKKRRDKQDLLLFLQVWRLEVGVLNETSLSLSPFLTHWEPLCFLSVWQYLHPSLRPTSICTLRHLWSQIKANYALVPQEWHADVSTLSEPTDRKSTGRAREPSARIKHV